ncbi:hypothetical protein [Pedobacter changchengzhani]|nr:hypothetical protein [Pedobacter changchengzhani]
MKRIFAIFFLSSIALCASAQKKSSGAIQFESTIDPAAMMAASGIKLSEQVAARIPSSSKSQFELLFTATNASYMPVEDNEDSNGAGGGNRGGFGRMMRFAGMGGAREYYYSFADKKLTEVFDVSDTTYYMASKLQLSTKNQMPAFRANPNDSGKVKPMVPPVIEVVKTDSTRKIIGFNCKEVIVKSTRKVKILDVERNVTDETHIWYTTELGFDFSPNPNLWTEGTVLAIDARGTSTTAKSIEYRNVSIKDVTAPKKAKLITEEEYQAKLEAMMKRFRGNRTGGGAVRTITVN